MAKTLLQIVKQVAGELQFNVPNTVLTSTDLTVQQIKYLTVAACDELADGYDWKSLLKTHTFSTSDGTVLYDLPDDYLRIVPDSNWDRSGSSPLIGNVNTQTWEALRSGMSANGPTYRFRLVGEQFEISPTPSSTSSTLAFNYISNNYVIDSEGNRKAEFTADGDKTAFHDRLLINFVKLKVWEIKGFDTTALANNFNTTLAQVMGNDVPAPSINAGGYGRTYPNIPDGNFGV